MSIPGIMNHPDLNSENSLHQSSERSERWQAAITSIAILLIAYYAWPYLTYETTIKQRLYNIGISMVPTRFVQLLHSSAARASGLPRSGIPSVALGPHNKTQALQQIFEGSGVSSVVQRARSLSGYDTIPAQTIEATFAGLGNWDNSCFQNSVLQGLASLSAFTDFVERNRRICAQASTVAPTHEALQVFLQQLQQQGTTRNTLWPPQILRSMDTWQQQDAQEYFSKIMDALEKESVKYQRFLTKQTAPDLACLRQKGYGTDERSSEEQLAPTQRMNLSLLPANPMNGFLAQTLRCQRCKFSEGMALMPFSCLTLNLGLGGDRYLEDLLDEYTEAELIEGVECEECTRLVNGRDAVADQNTTENRQEKDDGRDSQGLPEQKRKVLSTKAKRILLGRLPRNLSIHINRSIYDNYGTLRKNTSVIRFPSFLDIGKEWMASIGDLGADVYATYELRSIVTHQGRHDNGHYVACGKRGKEWYSFNDEIVTNISEDQVLRRGHVFMLFYEQIDSKAILEVPIHDENLTGATSERVEMQQITERCMTSNSKELSKAFEARSAVERLAMTSEPDIASEKQRSQS